MEGILAKKEDDRQLDRNLSVEELYIMIKEDIDAIYQQEYAV